MYNYDLVEMVNTTDAVEILSLISYSKIYRETMKNNLNKMIIVIKK